MFHSGFSGARQALSAILLNSSESLPRADRDGGPGPGGFSCLPSPHAVTLPPERAPLALPSAPGSRHPTTLRSPCSLLICAQLAGSLPHPPQPPTPAS